MAMIAAGQLHDWSVAQGWDADDIVAHLQSAVDALAATNT
jgi:hypothetical protein